MLCQFRRIIGYFAASYLSEQGLQLQDSFGELVLFARAENKFLPLFQSDVKGKPRISGGPDGLGLFAS
jgi:hypothetical protein